MLTRIAAQEGWGLKFVFGSWAAGLNRIREDKIHLMTSIAYTKDRDAYMDFSRENILTMWGQVYVRVGRKIKGILDLEGLSVAVMKRGINGINFRSLLKSFGIPCQIIVADSYDEAAKQVESGLADACVINNVHGFQLQKKYEIMKTPIMFNPFRLLFAVPEGKYGRLLSVIDRYVSRWKQNKNSFYYQRVHHWYGGQEPARVFIPKWVFYASAAGIGLILCSFIWILTLKVQVKARRRAQEALKNSENRFRCLSDASFEGIAVMEKDVIIEANRTLSEIFGYRMTTLIRMPASDLIAAEDRGAAQKEIRSVDEKPFEIRGMKKDGTVFPIAVQTKDFVYRGRQVRIAAVRDLTAQKNAEAEIKILRGILPLCSFCKKIRDDQGYWEQVDVYLHKYSEADISHGICPDCMKRHYPEFVRDG